MIPQRYIKRFLERSLRDYRRLKGMTERQLESAVKQLPMRPHKWDKLTRDQKICVLILALRPRFAIWSDPGAGKTLIAIVAADYHERRHGMPQALVLVPRRANKDEWALQVEEHSPETGCMVLRGSNEDKWRQLSESDECLLVVETYAGFTRMVSEKSRGRLKPSWDLLEKFITRFGGIVCDECFVGNTKVLTLNGYRRIDSIKAGTIVISSGRPSRVARVIVKKSNVVVSLKLGNGTIIKVTPNHPFLTKRGWICAGNLEGEYVLRAADLRILRGIIQSGTVEENQILFDLLRSEDQSISREAGGRRQGMDCGTQNKTVQEDGGEGFGADARVSSIEVESNVETNRTSTFSNWWERAWANGTAEAFARGIRPAMETGVRHFIGPKASWLSNLLQGRFRLPEQEISNRMRWNLSQQSFCESPGSEKGCQAFGIRVESVTVEEFDHSIDVFDLKLEGCPHYFVEDVLVHNSSMLGGGANVNKQSLIFLLLNQLSLHVGMFVAMSGTPFGRDPSLIWAQMYLVDRGETLGKSLGLFQSAFFGKPDYWGKRTFLKDKRKDLNRLLAHNSIRFKVSESELPKRRPIRRYVSIPTEQQEWLERFYDVLEHDPDKRKKESAFLRIRQLSSGFVGFTDDESGERAQVTFAENPKLEALCDYALSIPLEYQFLVFHEWIISGEWIAREFSRIGIDYTVLRGKTANPEKVLRSFKNGDKQALIVNHKSGDFGLNLQAGRYAIYYESPVSAITRKQTERRIIRRYSKNKWAAIVDLVMRGTMDERVLRFHAEGESLFDAILDGTESAREAS